MLCSDLGFDTWTSPSGLNTFLSILTFYYAWKWLIFIYIYIYSEGEGVRKAVHRASMSYCVVWWYGGCNPLLVFSLAEQLFDKYIRHQLEI